MRLKTVDLTIHSKATHLILLIFNKKTTNENPFEPTTKKKPYRENLFIKKQISVITKDLKGKFYLKDFILFN